MQITARQPPDQAGNSPWPTPDVVQLPDMSSNSASNIMTDAEAQAFLDAAKQHADETANRHFDSWKDNDEQLARGPDRNDGVNEFLRSRDMNWADFERGDHYFAHYFSDMYTWWQGYEYRRLLVRRYRDSVN